MKLILQATLLGAALLTAGVQAAGDPEANQRLWTAVTRGDLAGVQLAEVQKELPPTGNADVNTRDQFGSTALMYAAQRGEFGVVNALIKAGANVNARTERNGMTALIAAAQGGHLDVVNALIKAGADVNAKGTYGYTALAWAQHGKSREPMPKRRDFVDIVNALKAAGAK